MPTSPEVRHLKKCSNQDNKDVKLSSVRMGKELKTVAANRKPASGKIAKNILNDFYLIIVANVSL